MCLFDFYDLSKVAFFNLEGEIPVFTLNRFENEFTLANPTE